MKRTLVCVGLLITSAVWGCGSGGGEGSPGTGGSAGAGTGATASGGGGAGGGGSGGQSSGGASSGGTSSGGSSSGGSTSFVGQTRADSGATDAVSGSAHVAVAPDGTLYVTWVSNAKGLMVARSKDGGQSFEAPVQVQGSMKPMVSMARHPYVMATNTRVVVSFNEQGGTVYVHEAPATGALAFGAGKVVGADVTTAFRDFPKPVFLGQDLAVIWHGYPTTGERIYLSRESKGFKSEEVSGGAPGLPCECCPLDVLQTSGGNVVAVFRNNDSNIREMWSAQAVAGGAFAKWAAVSKSEGMVMSCPMQGPRVVEVGTTLHAVWSSRGSNSAGEVFQATSTDGGDTWSGGASAGGFQADEPTIAVGASGKIFVTGVTGSSKSALVSSSDGKSWSAPEPLKAADGDLKVPQAQSTAGIAVLAAVSTAGSVWVRRLE